MIKLDLFGWLLDGMLIIALITGLYATLADPAEEGRVSVNRPAVVMCR